MGRGMGGMSGVKSSRNSLNWAERFVQEPPYQRPLERRGDTLWGYSDTLGKWTKISIPKA